MIRLNKQDKSSGIGHETDYLLELIYIIYIPAEAVINVVNKDNLVDNKTDSTLEK